MKIETVRSLSLLLLFMTFFQVVYSQTGDYSRVTVFFEDSLQIDDLARTGIDLTHGHMVRGKSFTTDLSKREIDKIRRAGFNYDILIGDVQDHYQRQLTLAEDQWAGLRNTCDAESIDSLSYKTPQRFELGSMGGYFTYEEMLEEIDRMRSEFPDLISVREKIGDIRTHEDRPIWWVRLSDDPDIDEPNEPEVLYTALHHAREPLSLTQMIYFMWYLLENYDSDEQIRFLVNESEMYFVPCLNPDGYIYNQTNYPSGGGMWRKNRRDNQDGTYGVDLNRNYGYEWGYNDEGSSPDTGDQTYRGPYAFSEPETQAIRQFCNDHEFRLALNYHTYGNLLIYPWGYSDAPSQDSMIFFTLSGLLTTENDYRFGTGSETVGYTVNGNSDDWMYGEDESKPSIFAFTPEVGSDVHGFWPPVDKIIPYCKEVVKKNINTVYSMHNFGLAILNNDPNLPAFSGELELDIQQYGLSGGELDVSIKTMSPYFENISSSQNVYLDFGENELLSFAYELRTSTRIGEDIQLEVMIYNGVYTSTFPITVRLNPQETLLADNALDLDEWITEGAWGLSQNYFKSGPTSFTDSPGRDYSYSTLSLMEYDGWLDLTNATNAYLRFWTRYNISENGDYAQVEISTDGETWKGLCGNYTEEVIVNISGAVEPAYTGQQENWVLEQVDLADYAGENCRLRFSMQSGSIFQEGDGIYVDDIELKVFLDESTSLQDQFIDIPVKVSPNPTTNQCRISGLEQYLAPGNTCMYRIFDVTGNVVDTGSIIVSSDTELTLPDLVSGMYIIQVAGQFTVRVVVAE